MDEKTVAHLEELLQDTLEVAEENNKMLHSLKRTALWSFWGKLLLWLVIIILPFIVLGPFLRALFAGLPGDNTSKSVFGLPSAEQVQGLLQAYREASSTK